MVFLEVIMKGKQFFQKDDFGYLGQEILCLIILVSFVFVSCNANYKPSFKESITDAARKSRVSHVIDSQLQNVKEYLDEDLQKCIEEGVGSRAGTALTGSDIVELTLAENGGRDYLDFCYAMDWSQTSGDPTAVMDTAKSILSAEEYGKLCQRADEVERAIMIQGEELARGIPANQQAAFYKDLKLLVTRALVLLTAGVVYACLPNLVFWGKVSAACAISVGAGLVAISIMSLYEYFRFGTADGQDFESWFKEMLSIPKADFALTTSVAAIGDALGAGPVVTGIIICVFGLYNVIDLVRTMLKTYNINA